MSAPTDDILKSAAEYAASHNLPYAGAVTPAQANRLIQGGAAKLVDVRFKFEREYVGRVPETVGIEWKDINTGAVNPDFVKTLSEQFGKDDKLMFLCRSGVRSDAAAKAATQAGFTQAYNILEGFEGDLDEAKHRGNKGGWRRAGLPWIQG
ncbi:MAG TPA: rhodanese-like domain-containing protein [Burkholderiales bacterium]|nr:rhodanese-like domain-containing protein [Burkholderiales bacterium]